MVLPIASLFLLLIAFSGLHISVQAPMNDASNSGQDITGPRGIADVLGTYYWNILINQIPVEINVEAYSQTGENASEGPVNRRRNKRAIMSWVVRQWKRITSNAKLLVSNEDIKIYTKSGDYNRALADFRSLRPTNVESYSFDLGVHIKSGSVGSLRVSLLQLKKDGSAFTIENYLYLFGPAVRERGIRYIVQKGPTLH